MGKLSRLILFFTGNDGEKTEDDDSRQSNDKQSDDDFISEETDK